ncbi:hypothetical protein [Halobellus rufus]|uniref:hypothetical protein n=1 Tax=Halobellus rufus TaxID=1448860 RepID=UPI00067953E6|nr:hypothetical protein [Halobellus rufus]
MAPAIAHFLVGASLLLFGIAPFILRYGIDRAYMLWVIPVGGIWGIAPDFHHIAPFGRETLYAFHNSSWVELFALHYTLDRTTIRLLYHESIFAAIALFLIAIGAVWFSESVRTAGDGAASNSNRLRTRGIATVGAAGMATLTLGVLVSVQELLSTVALLHTTSGVLAGGIIVIAYGLAGGVVWGLGLEIALSETAVRDPLETAKLGSVEGVIAWLLGVVGVMPLLTDVGFPLLHLGSLIALLGYGVVFGVIYGVLRGSFQSRS